MGSKFWFWKTCEKVKSNFQNRNKTKIEKVPFLETLVIRIFKAQTLTMIMKVYKRSEQWQWSWLTKLSQKAGDTKVISKLQIQKSTAGKSAFDTWHTCLDKYQSYKYEKKIAGKSACDIWHTCLVDSKRCKVCVCNVNANVADCSPIWSLCFNLSLFGIGWSLPLWCWWSSQSRMSKNHQNGYIKLREQW